MRTVRNDLSFGESVKVVLIATSHSAQHDENLPGLPHVSENVDRLSRVFQDPDVIGLPASDIVRIVDSEQATEIATKVARAGAEARDTLIVYYAGHGLRGDQKVPLYLCSTGTTYADRSYSGLPISKIREAIADSPAQRRILILDCCFAGAGLHGAMSDGDVVSAVEHDIDITGTYAVAAVPADQKALAPPGDDVTKFTGELIGVLERGVKDGSELLSIEDVFSAVKTRINQEAMPLPQRTNWEDGGKFVFARNRFFDFDDLSQLKQSVEGLRDTVTEYGLKLQSLQDRVEEAPSSAIENSENADSGIWSIFRAQEREWNSWPGYVKERLLLHLRATRNGVYLFTGQLFFIAVVLLLHLWCNLRFSSYSLADFGGIAQFASTESPETSLSNQAAENLLRTWAARIVVFLFAMEALVVVVFYSAIFGKRELAQSANEAGELADVKTRGISRSYAEKTEVIDALNTRICYPSGVPIARHWAIGILAVAIFYFVMVSFDLGSVWSSSRPFVFDEPGAAAM